MITIALLAGIWTTNCTQMQTSHMTGFARETYSISENGNYAYSREWYVDGGCNVSREKEDLESGTVELGWRASGIFISGETYEADYTTSLGKDLGAVEVKPGSLKFARGMRNSTFRNTMVGVFEYVKQ